MVNQCKGLLLAVPLTVGTNIMLLQKVRFKGYCSVLYNLPINKKFLSINVLAFYYKMSFIFLIMKDYFKHDPTIIIFI